MIARRERATRGSLGCFMDTFPRRLACTTDHFDPLITLAHIAARTSVLRLATGIKPVQSHVAR
jgi:alkanesulfonate monooxygenase SsuD/methylene tetrahydromethanopterin reductase-like flavin-dependent oxidoreductase (luciferase family)